jgi:RpiB/LacA/LacB family sugar-phosphate isomerase
VKVVLGADHAGYELKEEIKRHAAGLGHDVIDVGTDSLAPVDYPDFARAVGEAVVQGRAERGVLICGSGVGASIAANKVPGIRAAICHDCYSARQGVEHDDMNVLTLGARVIGVELAQELVSVFLGARFTAEERHSRRVGKIASIEQEHSRQQGEA